MPETELAVEFSPHPCVRAMERYGVLLTTAELELISASLAAGGGLLLRRQSDGCEQHLVQLPGCVALVVYDPSVQRVLTFLPRENALAVGWGRYLRRRASGHA